MKAIFLSAGNYTFWKVWRFGMFGIITTEALGRLMSVLERKPSFLKETPNQYVSQWYIYTVGVAFYGPRCGTY